MGKWLLRQVTAIFNKDRSSELENCTSWEEADLKETAENSGIIITEDVHMLESNTRLSGMGSVYECLIHSHFYKPQILSG